MVAEYHQALIRPSHLQFHVLEPTQMQLLKEVLEDSPVLNQGSPEPPF